MNLSSAPASGETAWLAPSGITSASSLIANGSTITSTTTGSIIIPTTPGSYKLYIIKSGTISPASTHTVTVKASDMSTVIQTNLNGAAAGTSISLSSAPQSGEMVYIAPDSASGLLYSGGSANITSITNLAGDGSSSSITTPTIAGTYYLYLVDCKGNILKSTNTITVAAGSPYAVELLTQGVGGLPISGLPTVGTQISSNIFESFSWSSGGGYLEANIVDQYGNVVSQNSVNATTVTFVSGGSGSLRYDPTGANTLVTSSQVGIITATGTYTGTDGFYSFIYNPSSYTTDIITFVHGGITTTVTIN
ncbi:hypothetical protein [Desulfosporosinus sp. FKA]|uniref:hypothetical protein n=1 Tax=Desulfosporosinus sp. FKA TaxID=1969834 RepID=UPI000B498153|nr:hypothetical protein [Desulfosporosinus sp. FKA]